MTDHRSFRAEFRAVNGSEGRQFWAMPLVYEVVDDFGTIWTDGVFAASVRDKFPALMWGHAGWNDIAQMMGGGIDYRDTNGGPETLFELLAEDENPNTRILAGLMKERATGKPFVRDVSVGFDRMVWDGPGGQAPLAASDREMRDRKGRPASERMRVAGWDELSVVVAGAVPGAKALSGVRSKTRAGVALDDVTELARRLADGEITRTQALAALDLLGGEGSAVGEPGADDTPPPAAGDDEIEAALAEAGDALDDLEV